jgi:hypothetical protein
MYTSARFCNNIEDLFWNLVLLPIFPASLDNPYPFRRKIPNNLLGRVSSIDGKRMSRHKRRIIRGQKQRCTRNLLRFAESAAKRMRRRECVVSAAHQWVLARRVYHTGDQRCVDISRADGVDVAAV